MKCLRPWFVYLCFGLTGCKESGRNVRRVANEKVEVDQAERVASGPSPELIERSSRLTDATLVALSRVSTDAERIPILLRDLRDRAHYLVWKSYDRPELTREYVFAMSSGRRLLAIAKKSDELSYEVRQSLLEVLEDPDSEDMVCGVAMYYLAPIARDQDLARLETVGKKRTQTEVAHRGANLYWKYYFQQMRGR